MNRPAFQWRSLNTRITLATLGILLAGIWTLSYYAGQILRKEMEARLGEQEFATVSLVAAQVDCELTIRQQALQMVARTAARIMQDEGPAGVQRFVDEQGTLQALFSGGVVVVDASGTVIADYPVLAGRIGGQLHRSRCGRCGGQRGRTSIGKPVLGKKLGKPVFGMATLLFDAEGRVIGALSGVINLGIPSFLEQITESHYGKTGGYLLIDKQHRLVVTATDKARVMEQLRNRAYSVDGSRHRWFRGFGGSRSMLAVPRCSPRPRAFRSPTGGGRAVACG